MQLRPYNPTKWRRNEKSPRQNVPEKKNETNLDIFGISYQNPKRATDATNRTAPPPRWCARPPSEWRRWAKNFPTLRSLLVSRRWIPGTPPAAASVQRPTSS